MSIENTLTVDVVRKLFDDLGRVPPFARRVVMHPAALNDIKRTFQGDIFYAQAHVERPTLFGYPVVVVDSLPKGAAYLIDLPWESMRKPIFAWDQSVAPRESRGQRRRRMLRLRRDERNARVQGWTMREGFGR